MNVARLLLLCALGASLVGCAQARDPLEVAQAAMAAGDFASARTQALALLEADDEDVAALELLARAQLAMGQGGEATQTLARIASLGGEVPDAALLAAEARLQQGEPAAALELLGEDRSAEGWRLRALAAAAQGDDAAARRAFASGRAASGDRGKLLAAEASFHLDRGELSAAAEAVSLAVSAAPERIETVFVSARLADAQGDPLRALSSYLRIVDQAPMDRPALIAAIAASERAGQGEVTRRLILYGAQTRPADPEFVYLLARLDAQAGNWEAVRARLQGHESELAELPAARLLYAEALLELGQVETARSMAAPLVARFPADPQVMRVQSAIEAAS